MADHARPEASAGKSVATSAPVFENHPRSRSRRDASTIAASGTVQRAARAAQRGGSPRGHRSASSSTLPGRPNRPRFPRSGPSGGGVGLGAHDRERDPSHDGRGQIGVTPLEQSGQPGAFDGRLPGLGGSPAHTTPRPGAWGSSAGTAWGGPCCWPPSRDACQAPRAARFAGRSQFGRIADPHLGRFGQEDVKSDGCRTLRRARRSHRPRHRPPGGPRWRRRPDARWSRGWGRPLRSVAALPAPIGRGIAWPRRPP